ncbi:MAG: DNA-binding protein, partial [Verrucomicrobia bacterium]|nr:DNA-binding protein [Verrucomicrobiota bacterium]
MNRVAIKPQLLRWACERAGYDRADLEHKFPHLAAWEAETAQPTLKQVEAFAKATYTPVGYLFLPEPPVENIPIPDFRAPGNERIGHPSPDLLDTIYVCQQRQEWFRNYARSMGESLLAFVGSARVGDDVIRTAARIRTELGFDLD